VERALKVTSDRLVRLILEHLNLQVVVCQKCRGSGIPYAPPGLVVPPRACRECKGRGGKLEAAE
jgi:hypothetical protein